MSAPLDHEAIIEAVADRVGYGQGAWDVVPPEELVAAFAAVLALRSEAEERLIQAALDWLSSGSDSDLKSVMLAAAEVRYDREGSSNG